MAMTEEQRQQRKEARAAKRAAEQEALALEVDCGRCRAPAGRRCQADGAPRDFHPSRLQSARRRQSLRGRAAFDKQIEDGRAARKRMWPDGVPGLEVDWTAQGSLATVHVEEREQRFRWELVDFDGDVVGAGFCRTLVAAQKAGVDAAEAFAAEPLAEEPKPPAASPALSPLGAAALAATGRAAVACPRCGCLGVVCPDATFRGRFVVDWQRAPVGQGTLGVIKPRDTNVTLEDLESPGFGCGLD